MSEAQLLLITEERTTSTISTEPARHVQNSKQQNNTAIIIKDSKYQSMHALVVT